MNTPIHIAPVDVADLVAQGAVFVDVREHQETTAGAAPGASFMPLQSFNVDALPQNKPLILICRSGGRSIAAANALAEMGYATYNVQGGMGAWAASGLPVVAENGAPGHIL